MRLFIAREALDPHLKVSGAVLNSKLPIAQRIFAAIKAAWFYAFWYPEQWLPFQEFFQIKAAAGTGPHAAGVLVDHLRYAARTSRRLARSLFHAMVRFGPKLEREQVLLGRFVDIGTELFAMTTVCLRAERLLQSNQEREKQDETLETADYFCKAARLTIEEKFRGIAENNDRAGYKLAQRILAAKVPEDAGQ